MNVTVAEALNIEIFQKTSFRFPLRKIYYGYDGKLSELVDESIAFIEYVERSHQRLMTMNLFVNSKHEGVVYGY